MSKVFWGFFRNEKQVQNISSRLQTYSPLRFSTGLGKFIKVMFNRIIFISLSDIFHHTLRPKFLNPPFLILTVIFSSSSSWYILACFMIDKAISGIYLLPYCQIHAIKTRLGSSFSVPCNGFYFSSVCGSRCQCKLQQSFFKTYTVVVSTVFFSMRPHKNTPLSCAITNPTMFSHCYLKGYL